MKPKNQFDTNPMVRIPKVICTLEKARMAYRIIEAQSNEASNIADWIEHKFPITGAQIDWLKVPNHTCVAWVEIKALTAAFQHLAKSVEADTIVIITWSDALSPSLELRMGDAIRVSQTIFETQLDTWIVCRHLNWCFEAHHE